MSSIPAAPPVAQRRTPAGAIVMLILGCLLTIAGLPVLIGGIAASGAAAAQGSNGFFTSPATRFATDSYALTTPDTSGFSGDSRAPRMPFDIGELRLRAVGDQPLFIGIARQSDVDQYFAGVQHTQVTDVRYNPFRAVYRDVPGRTAPNDPTSENFWVKSANGSGPLELRWTIQPGDWALVVMNENGSAGVTTNVQAGFRSDLLAPIALGILVSGFVLLVIGIPLIIFGALGIGRSLPPSRGAPAGMASMDAIPPAAATPAGVPGAAGTAPPGSSGMSAVPAAVAPLPMDRGWQPVRVIGRVEDGALSRWLWLVKWVLVIPHYILLAGLWVAFFVTTIV